MIEVETKEVNNINQQVTEEAFLIEHSGELPEVAYYNSIYYLCEDKEGPKLKLSERELLLLKKAVIKQYLRIIKRDLTPSNKNKRIYRGIERAWVNWKRLLNFTKKFNLDITKAKKIVQKELISFLEHETNELILGKRVTFNISKKELIDFLNSLEIEHVIDKKIKDNLYPILKD